ncbi:GNAT family N-acetyltransferase [Roseovarius sp. A46]|uniref:GNAT family N-acetyltransferase n=1 Tax=Roseovarius sp. A46 TaxID=2109331 RepID=UPI00101196F3|nr:N-acetyltransferase [Roseovarius sp. A46]RXV66521.1 GNAT family N-acetyltransferase [Roseovarius sp. A46]
MEIINGIAGREEPITALFHETFTASEGAAEGRIVAGLAHDLLTLTPASDIRVFRVEETGRVIGAAIFSRLIYPMDTRRVMLLSPMAVAPDWQGRGVGQGLLRHALEALRAEVAEVALTYGDPAFYRRVGFAPVTEAEVQPPLPLSAPHGWLGLSLTGDPMPALSGVPVCAAVLNRADIW